MFPRRFPPAPLASATFLLMSFFLLADTALAQTQQAPPLPPGAIRCLAKQVEESLHTVAFSPDGKTLAIANNEVGLWDLKTGKKLPQRFAYTREAGSVVFSPDGKTLVVTSLAPKLGIVAFDVASGKLIHKFFPPGNQRFMAGTVRSPDGKTLAAVVSENEVRFWDLASRVELSKRRIHAPNGHFLTSLRYAPDGKTLAGGICPRDPWSPKAGTACVGLWDAGTGRLLRTYESKGDQEVNSLAFSADGRLLACGVVEWKLRQRWGYPPDLLPRLDHLLRIPRVRLWEVATGKLVLSCQFRRGAGWGVPSSDGRYLLTANEEGGMTLWDAIKGKPSHTFRAGDSYINSGLILADGKTVVTLNSTNSAVLFTVLYFWDVGAKMKPLVKGSVLEAGALARLWQQLGGSDTMLARQALWALVASPGQSVPFLHTQLRPALASAVKYDDANGIEKLVAALDSPHFASRVHARVQLERLHRHAEAALRRALKKPVSLQQKKEIEAVLKALEWPYTFADQLRRLRAIEALERIGTPPAHTLLKEVAKGASRRRKPWTPRLPSTAWQNNRQ